MAFTYDPTTNLGYVRLLISDTDASSYTFTDEELTAFLAKQEQNVYLAAAEAFGSIVRARSMQSKSISREGYSSSEYSISELKSMIEDLKQQAITAGGLQSTELGLTDDHMESYRPGWRSVNDTESIK